MYVTLTKKKKDDDHRKEKYLVALNNVSFVEDDSGVIARIHGTRATELIEINESIEDIEKQLRQRIDSGHHLVANELKTIRKVMP